MPVPNRNLKGRPGIIQLNSQAARVDQAGHNPPNHLPVKRLRLPIPLRKHDAHQEEK